MVSRGATISDRSSAPRHALPMTMAASAMRTKTATERVPFPSLRPFPPILQSADCRLFILCFFWQTEILIGWYVIIAATHVAGMNPRTQTHMYIPTFKTHPEGPPLPLLPNEPGRASPSGARPHPRSSPHRLVVTLDKHQRVDKSCRRRILSSSFCP